MPESQSPEEVAKATEKAIAPPPAKVPKPILKEPSFELPTKAVDDSDLPSPMTTRKIGERTFSKPSVQEVESTTSSDATVPALETSTTV